MVRALTPRGGRLRERFMSKQDTTRPKVLVVDDLVENTNILRDFLSPRGYDIVSAFDGEEALACVDESPPDIILLDLAMPKLDGFEVCRRLKEDPGTRHIPVIVVTGLADREANIRAVKAGADDFLLKPFDSVLLFARIQNSLRSKRRHDQIIHYQRSLEERISERTKQLARTQRVTVFSLAKLAESRDNETGKHLERIRSYARILAGQLAKSPQYEHIIDDEYVTALYDSSPLHDIGKVGIPDRILLKPGKLSPNEWEIMKLHSRIGGDTLYAADEEAGEACFLGMGRDIAYYHHERWDGAGYPDGREGDDIPLSARIVALADVYDALTSKRPYKSAFSHEKSKGIIIEERGTHFDPDIVDAMLACESQFLETYVRFKDEGEASKLQMLIRQLEQCHADAVNGAAL